MKRAHRHTLYSQLIGHLHHNDSQNEVAEQGAWCRDAGRRTNHVTKENPYGQGRGGQL